MWDPVTYLRYGDERGRPFGELLSRVAAQAPRAVVDLGCGPGQLTVELARRWPGARVVGLDASSEMIDHGRDMNAPVDFVVGDLRDWSPPSDVDVVISHATLQWVDGHDKLMTRWVAELPARAWLAVQMPGNFDAPSHQALREVATRPEWRERLASLVRGPGAVLDPTEYAAMLIESGCSVDAWETTYVHLLPVLGDDHPVLTWMEGTALRPIRAALSDEGDWSRFRGQVQAELELAYPVRGATVYFPFRRIFVVARTAQA